MRPEGLGRELRPTHHQSPSQPQPGHTSSPLSPSALMTGHSAVLGARIQERNGAEVPPSPCPLTPAPGGGSWVKGTVSPVPQSFQRSRGHSDLQGQLEGEKVEELGGGHSAWAGRGLRAGGGCVEVSQGEASAFPETAGLKAAEPCRPLFNCRQRRLLDSSEPEHQG